MSRTEFPAAIRSRPVYGTLALRPGAAHLVVADGEGAEAVLALVAEGDAALLAAMVLLYMPGPNGSDLGARLQALGAARYHRSPSFAAGLPRLRRLLAEARMGTQIYLAGSEGLIGQGLREVAEAGLPWQAVQTEHRGSTVRRVQCVHCKGITENVATDPFACSHCGLHLFVRDHYSRRIAAFQGVNIDAEDRGLVPPPVVRFA